MLSIECLDPLNSDWGDDCMEGLVDWQAIEADMLEQRSDVIISEELEIFLDENGEGLAVRRDADLRLEGIVLVERNLVSLRDDDGVFLFGSRVEEAISEK